MSLADAIALGTAVGAFIGGSGGLLAPFGGIAELLDNGQRGAFVGAYLGCLLASCSAWAT